MNADLLITSIGAAAAGAGSINLIMRANRVLIAARQLESDKMKRSAKRIFAETAAFASLFAVTVILTADLQQAFYRLILFTLLYGISVVDGFYRIIPNEYVILLALTGAGMLFAGQSPVSIQEAFAGGLAGGLLFVYPFLKDRSCGGGDVKLCAAAGLSIGLGALLAALAAMGLVLFVYAVYILVKNRELILSKFLPMGPILSACIFLQIVLMDLIPWYGRFL